MRELSAAIMFCASVALFGLALIVEGYYEGLIAGVAIFVGIVSFLAWLRASAKSK
jgi:uncharacterized oligopeptide transporter (OPT) family protein